MVPQNATHFRVDQQQIYQFPVDQEPHVDQKEPVKDRVKDRVIEDQKCNMDPMYTLQSTMVGNYFQKSDKWLFLGMG